MTEPRCSNCKKYRKIARQDSEAEYGLCIRAAVQKTFGGPLRWFGGCCSEHKLK